MSPRAHRALAETAQPECGLAASRRADWTPDLLLDTGSSDTWVSLAVGTPSLVRVSALRRLSSGRIWHIRCLHQLNEVTASIASNRRGLGSSAVSYCETV